MTDIRKVIFWTGIAICGFSFLAGSLLTLWVVLMASDLIENISALLQLFVYLIEIFATKVITELPEVVSLIAISIIGFFCTLIYCASNRFERMLSFAAIPVGLAGAILSFIGVIGSVFAALP